MEETNRGEAARRRAPHLSFTAYELLVVVPALVGGAILVVRSPRALGSSLLLWAGIVSLVELLPVSLARGITVSMGFPLLLVVGFFHPPIAAGLTAFVGSSDPRELRREVGLLRAVFNRCQIALSVFVASTVFHALASFDPPKSSAPVLFTAAMLATVADYLVNIGLVTIAASILYKTAPSRVFRELRIGGPAEFLVSYLGLGVLGLILAQFYQSVGPWSVGVFLAPLLLARQMFLRSRALEEAHKELQDREQVLRALSNRMAEERQDERAQIAAYLHDDLAQLLFRLSIQVDIARRHLAAGKLDAAAATLEQIKETKNRTSDRVRALIRDLDRSPLGHAGLAEALHGFIAETARDSETRFHTDIAEVVLPPPIALLVYHIAREGVMNAVKHANASNFWLTVQGGDETVELTLRDDGEGFDAEALEPEGHYGLAMMRERALVGGGTFNLESARGEGTTIKVRFPTSWLQQEGSEPQPSPRLPAGDASPDSGGSETPEQAAASALA